MPGVEKVLINAKVHEEHSLKQRGGRGCGRRQTMGVHSSWVPGPRVARSCDKCARVMRGQRAPGWQHRCTRASVPRDAGHPPVCQAGTTCGLEDRWDTTSGAVSPFSTLTSSLHTCQVGAVTVTLWGCWGDHRQYLALSRLCQM